MSDLIVSYIERKGWQTTPAPGGWHVRRDETAFFLGFTASWACLQIPLAAPGEEWTDAQRARLYRALLQRNEAMFMAKFALDARGTPLLLVEIPVSGSVRLVDHALEALTRYADEYAALLVDPGADIPPAGDRAAKERYFDEPPGIPHEVMAYYVRAVEAQGWGARSKPKGITWLLGYKGQRMFEAYLTVTRSWTYFHIPALIRLPAAGAEIDPAVRQAFFSYLLGVNDALYMAKLGIDEHDQVILMLELPTQELEFDFFRTITRLLGAYLDLYAREIQIMSNLPADQKLMEMLV